MISVTALNSHVEVLLHYCLNVFSWEESTFDYNTVDRSTQRWNKRSPVTATDQRRPTRWNASGYFFLLQVFRFRSLNASKTTTASVHLDLNASPIRNQLKASMSSFFQLKMFWSVGSARIVYISADAEPMLLAAVVAGKIALLQMT